MISVAGAEVRVVDAILDSGKPGVVSIELEAQGNENAIGFTVTFDPERLTFESATLGSAASGATFNVNSTRAGEGRVGFVLARLAGEQFAAGTIEIFQISFLTAAVPGATTVSFGDDPVFREISDVTSIPVETTYTSGTVTINTAPVADAQALRTNEDTAVELALSASDVDNQNLTFTIVTEPTLGVLTGSAPNFVYTPNPNVSGSDNFTFKVNDGIVDSAPSIISIAIDPVNDAPVAVADSYSVDEDSPLAVTTPSLLANDSDIDLDALTASIVTPPLNGSVALNADGTFAYVPNLNFNGTDTFTYKANDGALDSVPAAVTIEVRPVNDPPVLTVVAEQSVVEGNLLSVQFSATDVDQPPDTLTFSLGVGAPSGTALDPVSGLFTWTPTEFQGPSTQTVTIQVTDDGEPALSATQTVTIVVSEANAAPALSPVPNQTINELSTLTLNLTATDVDLPANVLTFSLDPGAPGGASIDPGSGFFSWTPTEEQGPATATITVRVTDNGTPALSSAQTFTVSVGEVNESPGIAPIQSQTIAEGSPLTVQISAFDSDVPGNTISYSLQPGGPAGASINSATGEFSWTPTEEQGPGSYSISVSVTDDGEPSGTATQTFTVEVTESNSAPQIVAVANQTVTETQALTVNVVASDPDLPASILTFSLGAGAPAGATIDPSSGLFSWIPTEQQGPGTYNITVEVIDNGSPAQSATTSFNVIVNESNIAPVLGAIGAQSGDEGSRITFTAVATDSDLPADQLRFSLSGDVPAGASIDPVSGQFSWTPAEEQGPGTGTITIRVEDGGTPSLSAEQTVTITVREVNAPPVFGTIAPASIAEGTALNVTVNASDPDQPANAITYRLGSGAPAGATIDPQTGQFSWTPGEADGPGSVNVEIIAADNGTPSQTASATLSITVTEGNTAPVLEVIADQTIRAGDPLTVRASAADSDVPANTLTFDLGAGAPVGASINPTTGVFRWTPPVSQGGGTHVIVIEVSDNGTPSLKASQSFTVVVTPANTAPVLPQIADQTIPEGQPFTLQITATDADVPANKLTYSITRGAPAGATLDPATGQFSWAPTEEQGPGTNVVTVQVTDDGVPSMNASRSFTIVVREVNAPPGLAVIPNQTVDEGKLVSVTATATDPDIPANSLAYRLAAGAPAGAAIDPQSGLFTWTPTDDQGPNTNSITIEVTDSGTPVQTARQTFTVVVNEVNVAPRIDAIAAQRVGEGIALRFTVRATDPNAGQKVTYSLGSNAPLGAVLDPVTGEFAWTPTEAQGPSTNVVSIRATDDGAPPLRGTIEATIVVDEINTAPVLAAIGNQLASIDSPLTVKARATDSDLPANRLTFSLEANAPAGAMVDPATGVFAWTPTAPQGGTTNQIALRVTDNGPAPLSDVKTFTVIVRAAPNLPPALSAISNQTTVENKPTAPIVFTLADPDTPVANFVFRATSSDARLVPDANIRISGTGTNRTLTIQPALDQIGRATITLAAEENSGGKASTTFELNVTPAPPEIVTQPSSKTAIGGGRVTFEVGATGTKPLLYQWRLNGTPIPEGTNAVLVINSAAVGNVGRYSVIVRNAINEVTSQEATLEVNIPLRITKQPISQTVLAGANVTFVATASGRGPLSYQWEANGTAIPGATNPSLVLNSVQPAAAGDYRVVVTNALGSVSSDIAKLIINSQVTIVQQPQSLSVVAGTNVTFSVTATGTPPLGYQWQLNGVNLPEQTGPTLTIPAVKQSDAGEYSVVIGNNAGTVPSAKATLAVAVAPTVTRQPEPQTVLAGKTARFAVAAGGTGPLAYQWRFNGVAIAGAIAATLAVANVTAANEGNYTVVVQNAAGSVTSEPAPLKVTSPVVITEQPQAQTVNAGGAAAFSVAVTGTDPIQYQWRKNGVDVPGATQAALTIANAQAAEAGSYQVLVRNAAGHIQSQPATLTVNQGVTIIAQPQSQTATNGASVVFSVVAAGSGQLAYQWRFNGVDIPGARSANLTLSNVTPANAGAYTVEVSNVVGAVISAAAQLGVIVPPRIVTPPASQNVAVDSPVTFTVSATGDAPLSYQWQLNGISIPGATSDTFTIQNAQPSDAGNYTVSVENPGGVETSDPASLTLILPPISLATTPAAAPPLEVTEGSFDGGLNDPFGIQPARRNAPPGGGQTQSRWFSWRAPSSGIVTFNTAGSTFDTVMSIYSGTPDNLVLVGSDDDRGGFFSSQVRFNAVQGTTYFINITGFGGAAGRIVVSFKLATGEQRLPVIASAPETQTVAVGADVTFRVQAEGTDLQYQWLKNGIAIANETGTSLTVRNVQEADAVRYTVRVSSGPVDNGLVVESLPAEIQLGVDGALAEDKFLNAPRLDAGAGGGPQLARFRPGPVKNAGGSVARGYSGSQVFSTAGATKEQGEPNHADVVGGASQWFTYQPQSSGTLRVSTEGSDFDTVLAIYTGPGTDFASLKLEAFDNDGGRDKTSVAVVRVTLGTIYYVAVDGVKGAIGKVRLNYEFGQPPGISQQPLATSVNAGGLVNFIVTAVNPVANVFANFSYQWYRNGLPLAGKVQNSLLLINVQPAEEGDYLAVVTGFAGSVTSTVARLTVNVPVAFTVVPESQTVRAGESVTLRAAVSGTPPFQSQWRKDNVDLPGETGAELELTNIQAADAGSYSVLVGNAAGTAQSRPATLSVSQVPEITRAPLGLVATLGLPASLTVQASGTGQLSYQWRKNGVDLPGATGAQLNFVAVQPSDQGDYTVLVSNSAGSVLSDPPATMTVRIPLVVTSPPRNQTVNPGSSAVFSVAAAGSGPLFYQWKRNGLALTDGPLLTGANSPNLSLLNVQVSDGGDYTVDISDGAAVLPSPAATLAISAAPTITQEPQGQVVFVGGNVTFTVEASGSGTLQYQWFRNAEPIPGATASTYTIDNVTVAISGTYSVTVSNGAGSVDSALAVLTVLEIMSVLQVTGDGTFRFRLTVPEGVSAIVHYSDDLQNWARLIADPIPSGTYNIDDPGAATAVDSRFYAVELQ